MKTPISYYGGKQNLVKEILPLIPPHVQYVEPFLGGASVFFAKYPSKNEVINDIDERVVNFYKVCQDEKSFLKLQKMIKCTLHSESEYKKAKEILLNKDSDRIRKAWALWVQTNMSFGYIIFGGFAFGEEGFGRRKYIKRKNFLKHYMHRLEKVEIFQRDAIELIKLKDTSDTFFYCDPPYYNTECNHFKGYTEQDFIELLKALSNIKGKFLLSSSFDDNLVEYRNKYDWNFKDIKQVLLVSSKRKETKYKIECLTWNYNYKKQLKLF